MAGMRRSEVSALHWADVADAADGDGVLVTVRRSKTNQEGETTDVRFVKGGVARALRTLRAAASPAPEDRAVPLSPKMVGLRFQAAARGAGVEVPARERGGLLKCRWWVVLVVASTLATACEIRAEIHG